LKTARPPRSPGGAKIPTTGPRFTTNHKEVLDKGRHFADTDSNDRAEFIASACKFILDHGARVLAKLTEGEDDEPC
jgi:hypothetical protein